jgi:hypothetical protein
MYIFDMCARTRSQISDALRLMALAVSITIARQDIKIALLYKTWLLFLHVRA